MRKLPLTTLALALVAFGTAASHAQQTYTDTTLTACPLSPTAQTYGCGVSYYDTTTDVYKVFVDVIFSPGVTPAQEPESGIKVLIRNPPSGGYGPAFYPSPIWTIDGTHSVYTAQFSDPVSGSVMVMSFYHACSYRGGGGGRGGGYRIMVCDWYVQGGATYTTTN